MPKVEQTKRRVLTETLRPSQFVATRAFFTAGRTAAHAAHARLVTACKRDKKHGGQRAPCPRNDVTEGDDVSIPAEKYIYMHVMKFHNEH